MRNSKNMERWLLAVSVVLLLLPFVLLGLYAAEKFKWAEARVEEIEPRHARLLGLEKQKDEMETVLERVKTLRAEYVYPATQDAAQTGNSAQQRVREVFAGAGLQIIASQVLPAKADKGFDLIPLTIQAEGDALALQSALTVIPGLKPAIVVNELDVQLQGGLRAVKEDAAPRLTVRLTLSVLRERS